MDRRVLWLVAGLLLVPLAFGMMLFSVIFFIRTGDPMVLFFGLFNVVGTLSLVLIVVAVAHALTRDDLTSEQRLVWVAVSVFATPILAVGALVYLALGRERTAGLFRDLRFGRERAPPAR